MITLEQYVGVHENCADWNDEREANAIAFLERAEGLYNEMVEAGVVFHENPATKSQVSGQMYGGFRPQSCSQGAPNSSHKEGRAVDWYDPHGEIDAWLMAHQDKLVEHGIYIEHPDATQHWSHWSDKPPGSGKHVFRP